MHKFIKTFTAAVVLLSASVVFAPSAVAADREPSFVAAHLTDIHLRTEHNSVSRFQAFVSQMRKDHQDISIIFNTGDILDGKFGKWEYWTHSVQAVMSDLPIYSLLGNHDNEADISDSKALCTLLKMPARYYTFDHKGWRFFMLDGNTLHREKAQVEWLSQKLKATPARMHVAILCHQPVRSNKTVTSLLSSFPNVKLCLSGHTHLHNRTVINGVTYISGGSVSGFWWEQKPKVELEGKHKSKPAGFGLVKFYADGKFTYDYIKHDL
jgi:Icc protein